jgi:hypothetical protein
MEQELLQEIDSLYIRYGYEPRKTWTTRVYLFTKSIYNGADIVRTGNDKEVEELKKQYSDLGYAVKIRTFNTIQDAENTLFKDFFKADEVIYSLKRNYEHFVSKLMENLPEDAPYQYIRCPYDLTEYNNDNEDFEIQSISAESEEYSLVQRIVHKLNEHSGPLLIIIEAAAGYGKTCTAYEILKQFVMVSGDKIPFFTELSRDRQATVFKHILQYEIEDQFSNRVDSNVVIHQIKKGRIPLIIDGFDELISKDFSFSSNQFEQVESMLSTIVDLLTDNAKIIITSRKTAIFNSEEFHNWMLDRNIDYTLLKITIAEPSIENWLNHHRLEIIRDNNFPVEQISNPVLLTYLRYISLESLSEMIIDNRSIVEMYFNFLLTREQRRQNLLIEPDIQLKIFRKLVRFFTEFDVKSDSKDFVKEIFLEYNKNILEETRKKYLPEFRPRLDQLADILTNHAFLDRKEKNQIGIVNEFVLGTLIAENLMLGKYEQYDKEFFKKISQSFALLSIQAFQVQPRNNKLLLWEVFNKFQFPYDPQLFFKIDIEFKNEIVRNYNQAILNGFELDAFDLTKPNQFESTIFTNCKFSSCRFSFHAFSNSSFVNCKFYDCTMIENETYSDEYFTIFGSTDNNNFVQTIFDSELIVEEVEVNLEEIILSLYFKKGSLKPRHRQLSHIKAELLEYNDKQVAKMIHKLKTEEVIQFNGDLSRLTKKGISLFNEKYRSY